MSELDEVDFAVDADGKDRRMTSQTLERGLAVLEAVAMASETAPEGLGTSELSRQLGIHRTNVARLLATLADHKYVTRRPSGNYILGPRALEIAQRVHPVVSSVARPILQRLADQVGATSHLTRAEGDEAVSLLVVRSRTTDFSVSYDAGVRRPLNRGASGFAILASRPPVGPEPREVALARKAGWSVSSGQVREGAWGLAAPISHSEYRDLGVGVVLLGKPSNIAPIASAVLTAARDISTALG